ncbi:MAG: arginase family protein [Candidatus Margulisiibacteriota bacterium]
MTTLIGTALRNYSHLKMDTIRASIQESVGSLRSRLRERHRGTLVQQATEVARKGAALSIYCPINVALAHTAAPRLEAVAKPDSQSRILSRRPMTIVTVNSGFCAGKSTDPNLQTPNMVVSRLREMLLTLGDQWKSIGKNLKWVHAPTVFYPSKPIELARVDDRNPNSFKYIREAVLNYYFSYSTTINGVLERGFSPLLVGGDHSLAFASVSTVSNHYFRKTGKTAGLVWVDAHGDINTRATSPSGNFHGGPVAALLGISNTVMDLFMEKPLNPRNIVYIAIRDLDPGEIATIARLGIKVFSAKDIEKDGLESVMQQARAIAGQGTSGICVSFDIDGVEGTHVPGTGTPVSVGENMDKRGLTPQEAKDMATIFGSWRNLISFDMVEVNPEIDQKPGFPTVQLASEILTNFIVSRNDTSIT